MLTSFSLIAFGFFLQTGFGPASSSPITATASADTSGTAGPAVRITSPLGRSGTSGSIRIVAQIQPVRGVDLGPVQFFIDGQLFRTDTDGAPYVAEWVDENPFERREIAVAVTDALGHEVRDRIVLEPFDVVEEAQVTSVLVEAAVQDKNGRFLKSLPSSAFSVLEDGVPQALDLARHESVGATFALLIDSSASMSRRLDFVQRTAGLLYDYMTPLDRVLVAPFSKHVLSVTGPTDDRQTVADAIRAVGSNGGTAILDSLVQLSRSFPDSPGRRAIILITDGYDENSTSSVDEALAALKEARATVYALGIGGVAGVSLKGEKVLRRLAKETGGRVFLPSTESQLEHVHTALVDEVQNRYLLTYTPANQKQDGKWREIAVQVTDPTYKVAARPGYFAPRPPPVRPTIEFTATGPEGEYLSVSAEDLELVEDGVPQHVDTFHEASQPVSIILALDASGSMRRREADVIASARAFAAALRPEDKLAVMLFADEVTLLHDLTTNRDASREAIDGYKVGGGTALYDGVAEALARLKRTEGRKVIVAMTDGRDENNPGTAPGSTHTLAEVRQQLKDSGTTMFAIGLGTKVDSAPLQELANLSGGRALMPQDVSQLGDEFARVVEDLRRRYVIGYTSTNSERNGEWRNVRIGLKSAPQVTLRSTGGFTAPER
ncbi:MAG: VWA domain-containing protein [Acidobacteriota bacterium]|nr:VWA domain-containing protein [Acidobacteriota bacterium]